MGKAEKEQLIKELLIAERDRNRECDRAEKEWRSKETEEFNKANPPFYFNDYIFTQDARNAICVATFGHEEIRHHERNHRHGTYDEYVATTSETDAINTIIKGMVRQGLIKPSKTGTMVKVLF